MGRKERQKDDLLLKGSISLMAPPCAETCHKTTPSYVTKCSVDLQSAEIRKNTTYSRLTHTKTKPKFICFDISNIYTASVTRAYFI